MTTHCVPIDEEKVQLKSLALVGGAPCCVRIFSAANRSGLRGDLALATRVLGDRASFVKLDAGSAFVLDFLIAYRLGRLAEAEPEALLHAIPRDPALDSPIRPGKTQPAPARRRSVRPRPAQARSAQALWAWAGPAHIGPARLGSGPVRAARAGSARAESAPAAAVSPRPALSGSLAR